MTTASNEREGGAGGTVGPGGGQGGGGRRDALAGDEAQVDGRARHDGGRAASPKAHVSPLTVAVTSKRTGPAGGRPALVNA